jgi:hypothetical protein
VGDHIFEPLVLDIDVWKLQGANGLSKKCGFPRLRLDHCQFGPRMRNLQRNGRGAAARSDVEPPSGRICNVSRGGQWLD